MLSIGRIGAGDGYSYLTSQVASQDAPRAGERLVSYYERTGHPPGEWIGAQAAAFGLVGRVSEDPMEKLYGRCCHPVSGEQLGRRMAVFRTSDQRISDRLAALGYEPDEAERERIAREENDKGTPQAVTGFDLTFSAPKSVSVLWSLGGDEVRDQLQQAHETAWRDAIGWFEREVATTRQGGAGVAQVDVEGITGAAFEHWFSRSGDPQLHTHVAVSTMVRGGVDGKWLRLDSKALHAAAAAAGERYTGRLLAGATARLGVGWRHRPSERAGETLLPEVDGVSDDLVAAFSTRSAQVNANLAKAVGEYRDSHGYAPDRCTAARMGQIAVMADRPNTGQRSWTEQREGWKTTAAGVLGCAPEEVADSIAGGVLVGQAAIEPMPVDQAQALARRTLGRLVESGATWSGRDMQRRAAAVIREEGFRVDDRSIGLVVAALNARPDLIEIRAPDLVPVPEMLRRRSGESVFDRAGETRYTAVQVLDAEARLTELAVRRTAGERLAVNVADLGADQRAAVQRLVDTSRPLDALIGPAGSGKTTVCRRLVAAWREDGREVVVLAPTAVAAGVVGDMVGVTGDTLDAALLRWDGGRGLPAAGALILVDEASMATTPKLVRLAELGETHGAIVRVIGDPRQLKAVGPGGGLQLIAEAAGSPELTELRRFRKPWEGPATLSVRRGDIAAIDQYLEHGRVSSGLYEEVVEDVYRAWRDSPAGPAQTVMIASDNVTVQTLCERARADRVAAGDVEEGGVVLANGSTAGVGDVIVTRHNDRLLRTSQGPAAFVRNRDRWEIVGRDDAGALTVRHLTTDGTAVLPAGYVANHVELSYAHTGHGAQGLTVERAEAIIRPGDSNWYAYVALSRGRQDNMAHVVTERLEEQPHGYHPDLTARAVLAQVLATDEPVSAGDHIQATLANAANLRELTARYHEAQRIEMQSRLVAILGDRNAGGLLEQPDTWRMLDAAEMLEDRGLDAAVLLAAAGPDQLADVDRAAGALRPGYSNRPWPQRYGGLVSAPGSQVASDVAAYLEGLGHSIDRRRQALIGELSAGSVPSWAARLGERPADPAARQLWAQAAGQVAAWREAQGLTADRPLLGPRARPGTRDATAYLRAARAAEAAQEVAGVKPVVPRTPGDPNLHVRPSLQPHLEVERGGPEIGL